MRNKAGTEEVASTQWKKKGQKKREKNRNKVMEERAGGPVKGVEKRP